MINYYLCNKVTKEVLSIGPLPESWKNISGMADLEYSLASDLTWSGNPDMGFLTEEHAIALGVSLETISACKLSIEDDEWRKIRDYRDSVIASVRWRVDRYNDEVNLDKHPTENIMPVLKYIQQLRDVTLQSDPYNIQWPVLSSG
jgi:hypothetical protein